MENRQVRQKGKAKKASKKKIPTLLKQLEKGGGSRSQEQQHTISVVYRLLLLLIAFRRPVNGQWTVQLTKRFSMAAGAVPIVLLFSLYIRLQ